MSPGPSGCGGQLPTHVEMYDVIEPRRRRLPNLAAVVEATFPAAETSVRVVSALVDLRPAFESVDACHVPGDSTRPDGSPRITEPRWARRRESGRARPEPQATSQCQMPQPQPYGRTRGSTGRHRKVSRSMAGTVPSGCNRLNSGDWTRPADVSRDELDPLRRRSKRDRYWFLSAPREG